MWIPVLLCVGFGMCYRYATRHNHTTSHAPSVNGGPGKVLSKKRQANLNALWVGNWFAGTCLWAWYTSPIGKEPAPVTSVLPCSLAPGMAAVGYSMSHLLPAIALLGVCHLGYLLCSSSSGSVARWSYIIFVIGLIMTMGMQIWGGACLVLGGLDR